MNKTQNGFAVIESILILVVVAIIGGTGYYVWHTKAQSDKSLDNAANTSVKTTAKSNVTTQSTQSSDDYIVIKEWGVRAKLSGSFHLTYKINGVIHDSGSAFLSSTELSSEGRQCQEYGGLVERYKSDQHVYGGDGTDLGKTAKETAASLDADNYGQVGDYYFFYNSPQALCPSINVDDSKTVALQSDTTKAIRAMLPNLQAIPQ